VHFIGLRATRYRLNPVQVQKWSFALEKAPDLELDLVYFNLFSL